MTAEQLLVSPFIKPLSGQEVSIPGSKSVTNRALILAALCKGRVVLDGALASRDTRIMVAALKSLGFAVESDEAARRIAIEGLGGGIPAATAKIHIGNAGTAARFLTAFLCLRQGGVFHLDGDPAMRERPMSGLLDALESCGAARVEYQGRRGFFPFTLHTAGFPGGALRVDASASSQILSALMMIAPLGAAPAVFSCGRVRPAFLQITLEMMRQFGQAALPASVGEVVEIPSGTAYTCPSGRYVIEPDATAASYFAALPLAVGGFIRLPGMSLSLLQGDTAFLRVLGRLGMRVEPYAGGLEVSAPATIPDVVLDEDFEHFSDTFLTLAALVPLLRRPVTIRGIAHTRKQETDRVHGMAVNLAAILGPEAVVERGDSLAIVPDKAALSTRLRLGAPVDIQTFEDHRFAMSFGILGCHDLLGGGKPWIRIHDPACCGKTFPDFFRVLADLRARSGDA